MPVLLTPYSSIAPLSFTRCAQSVSPCARAGLAELVAMDARFKPFLTTLFSPASLQTDRDDEPPDVVAALDRSIDAFLMLLSDALLLPASHKPLEYLIRKYRCAHPSPIRPVQRGLAGAGGAAVPRDEPLRAHRAAALPQVSRITPAALVLHEFTSQTRSIQPMPSGMAPQMISSLCSFAALLHGRGSSQHSKWAPVLHGCKANGAAIPRAQLVQRCVKDDSFFHAMCHAVCLLLPCHVPCGMPPPPMPCAMRYASSFHAMCHAVCLLLPCHVPCGMPPPSMPCAMRYASSFHAMCHTVCLLLPCHVPCGMTPPSMPCAMRYASSSHAMCHAPAPSLVRHSSFETTQTCSLPCAPFTRPRQAEKAATCVIRDGPASAAPPAAPAMRLLTFTSVLLLEALAAMRVSVDALSHLLPFILNGLQPSAVHEHRLAAMMLVSQLANRSQLSTQVVNSLLVALLSPTPAADCAAPTARGMRAPPTAISMNAFLVVVHLSAVSALASHLISHPLSCAPHPIGALVSTQRILSLPSRAVANILTHKHFVDVLSAAAHKFNTAKILHLLADTLLPKIATSQAAADVLLAMLRQLPRAALSPLVPRLALSLLRFAVGKGLPQGAPVVLFSLQPRIQPLLLALSLKFTSPTDAAIAAVLESLASAPAERATLVSFLGTALSASPCALQQVDAPPAATETGVQQQQQQQQQKQQQQQLLSVHLAIDHTQWQVRKAAVEQLPALMAAAGKHTDTDEAAQGEMLSPSIIRLHRFRALASSLPVSVPSQVQSFVSSALQRRLADDSWEVLHAAVTSPLLPHALSASLLFTPLKAILLRPLPPASEPLPAHIKGKGLLLY
ncbi:unnamed protein product [Closterium sp. NIES-54]